VVTTGCVLNGLVHIGDEQRPSGRAGEPPTRELAESLRGVGFEMGRLKTGTPPRLDRRSIDFSRFAEALGDDPIVPFSFLSDQITRAQIACHVLYTTERVHEIVRSHIGRSPLFNGQISGIGPRYCPSLEDKVMRFPDRERRRSFSSPKASMWTDVCQRPVDESAARRAARDCPRTARARDAVMLRPASPLMHFIQPTELDRGLQTKRLPRLSRRTNQRHVGLRGSGRAGPDGVECGAPRGSPSVVLGRDEAYIGILVDDLVTRGCLEPYRMFTSRAEHRLRLRIDNADLRLTPPGRAAGLVSDSRWAVFEARRDRLMRNRRSVSETRVDVEGTRQWLCRRSHVRR
jgi:tRNA uridine 5-carboxymethylaminomethyl modification enzyme